MKMFTQSSACATLQVHGINLFRKCFFVLLLMSIGVFQSFGQTPTDGDYRTRATGTWAATTTWQVRTAGSWANITTPPTSANNVYIQSGHTITVGAAAACNDLHIRTGAILTMSTFTVTVSGKIRAYTGTAVTTTGADGTFYSGQTNTTPGAGSIVSTTGKLQFIGNSRSVTNVGEWSNAVTSTFIAEFAFTSGQSATLDAGFRSTTLNVSAGTTLIISAGATLTNNSAGLNAGTISNGGTATVTAFNNSGSITNLAASSFTIATSGTNSGTITNNGTTFNAASLNCTAGSITNNGTMSLTSATIGSAATLTNSGTTLTITTAMTMAGTLINSSGAITNSATTSAQISGTYSARGGAISSTPSYSGSGTLEYKGSGTQAATVNEWPASGSPVNVIIDNASGVTTPASFARTISGILTLNTGALDISGSKTLTFTGTVSTGTGTLLGNSSTTIIISGSGSGNLGTINFSGSAPNLGTFTMNRSGSDVTIGTDMTIQTNLGLTNGIINMGANKLTYLGTSANLGSAQSANNYVSFTNGEFQLGNGGTLGTTGTNTFTLPVGIAGASGSPVVSGYHPVKVVWTAQTTGTFKVNYLSNPASGTLSSTCVPTTLGTNRAGYILAATVTSFPAYNLSLYYASGDFNVAGPLASSVAIYNLEASTSPPWTRLTHNADGITGALTFVTTNNQALNGTQNFILGEGITGSNLSGTNTWTWKTNAANTNWNDGGNWTGGSGTDYPGQSDAGDNAIIPSGITGSMPTVNVSGIKINDLTVNGGTLTISSASNFTFTVGGALTVASGATIIQNSGNSTSFIVQGNWIHNGTFTSGSNAKVSFTGFNSAIVSGTGNITFATLVINKGVGGSTASDTSYVVEFQNNSIAVTSLTSTSGVLKISTSQASTLSSTSYSISSGAGVWLNSSTVTMNASATGGSTVTGLFRISDGAATFGIGGNSTLTIADGALMEVNGGSCTIGARLINTGTGTLNQGGGIITAGAFASWNLSSAAIDITGASNCNIYGGSLGVRYASNGSTKLEIRITNTVGTKSFTGGTVFVGDAVTNASEPFTSINIGVPINNFTIGGPSSTATLVTSALAVNGDITISSGCVLATAAINVVAKGDWINNNGTTLTGFTGTGSVTFSGASAQTIGGANSTSFATLIINNTSGVTLSGVDATIVTALTLTNGKFSIGSRTLTYKGTGANIGAGSTTKFVSMLSSTGGFVWAPAASVSTGTYLLPVGPAGTAAGSPTVNGYRPSKLIVGTAGTFTFQLGFIDCQNAAVSATSLPTATNNRAGYIAVVNTNLSAYSLNLSYNPTTDFNTASPATVNIYHYNGGIFWGAPAPAAPTCATLCEFTRGFLSPAFNGNFILAATGTALHTSATSYTWNGSVSTAWENASNWTGGAAGQWPDDVTDAVIIANVTNKPTLSSSVSVGNLTFNASAGALTLAANSSLRICGTMTLNTSTIVSDATSTIDFANAGPITLPPIANVNNYGNLILSGTGTKTTVTGMIVQGNLTIANLTNMTMPSSTTFNLYGDFANNGTFTAGSSSTFVFGNSASAPAPPGVSTVTGNATTFVNLTIKKAPSGTASDADTARVVYFNNAGLTTTTFNLFAGGTTGSGTIRLRSGLALPVGQPPTIALGTGLWLDGGTMAPTANSTTVNGLLRLGTSSGSITCGTTTSHTLTISSTGLLDILGGTLTTTGTSTSINLSSGSIANISAGTLTANGAITNSGAFTITGGTVNVGNSSFATLADFTLGASPAILTMSGGSLNISRSLSNISTGTLNITSGIVTLAKYTSALSSASPTALSSGATANTTIGTTIQVQRGNTGAGGDISIAATSGTMNLSGSTLQMGNASTVASQTMKINSAVTLNNLIVNGTNSPVAQLAADCSLNGTVTVNSGGVLDLLTFQLAGTGATTMNIASGATLRLGLGGSTLGAATNNFPNTATFAAFTLDPNSTVDYNSDNSTNAYQSIYDYAYPNNLTFSNRSGSGVSYKLLTANLTTVPAGNLTVNAFAALDVQTFNLVGSATKNLNLAANSVLRLSGTTGGPISGNNLPTGFGTWSDGIGGTTGFNATSAVEYYGTSPQVIWELPSGIHYGGVTVSDAATRTLNTNLSTNMLGSLTVNTGATLDIESKIINGTGINGKLILNGTGTLRLKGTNGGTAGSNFPSFNGGAAGAYTLASTSTTEYYAGDATTQYIWANSVYGNLTLTNETGSGNAVKTAGGASAAARNMTVGGNFTIGANCTYWANSADDGGTTHNHSIKGNWVNNSGTGAYTYQNANNVITFSGTGSQNIGGAFNTNFDGLEINNSGSGVTTNYDLTVPITLRLTNGVLTLGGTHTITYTGTSSNLTGGSSTGYVGIAVASSDRFVLGGGAAVLSGTYKLPVGLIGTVTGGRPITLALSGSSSPGATVNVGFVNTDNTVSATGVTGTNTSHYIAQLNMTGTVPNYNLTMTYRDGDFDTAPDITQVGIYRNPNSTPWVRFGQNYNGSAGGNNTVTKTDVASLSGDQNLVLGIGGGDLPFNPAAYYWVGGTSTAWEDASNWNPNTGYPNDASDTAYIDNASTPSFWPVISSDVTVKDLHLTATASGASLTLDNSSSIGILGNFEKTSGTVTCNTNSTIGYYGNLAQAVLGINYYNLTIGDAPRNGNVTFDNSAFIGIAGTFNPQANFTSGGYVVTGTTFNYNGGSQNVIAFPYNNLATGGSNTKALTDNVIVLGDLTLGSGTTWTPGSFTHTLYGNVTNNGNPTASMIATFTGPNSVTIGGSSTINFSTLTINKGTDTSTVVTVTNPIAMSNQATNTTTINNGMLRIKNGYIIMPNILPATAGLWFDTGAGNSLHRSTGNGSDGSFSHNGYLRISDGVQSISGANPPFSANSGSTTIIDGGTLELNRGGWSDGSALFYMDGGANFTVSAGTVLFDNPNMNGENSFTITIVSGTGVKDLSGGTWKFGSNYTTTTLGHLIQSYLPFNNVIVDGSTMTTSAIPYQTPQDPFTVNNLTLTNGSWRQDYWEVDLVIKGNVVNNGGSITNNGSTTNTTFNGTAAQTISGTGSLSLGNLFINNSNGLTVEQDLTIAGVLTFTNGLIRVGNGNFIFDLNATVAGTPGVTKMLAIDELKTGEVRRVQVGGNGFSFTFPVGETGGLNGQADYSPLTLNFSSLNQNSTFGVRVVNRKHPSNNSSTNYLNRYWTINNVSNASPGSLSCTVTGTYTTSPSDLVGSSVVTGVLNGTFNQVTNPWVKYSTLSGTVSATGLTQFSNSSYTSITGITSTVMTMNTVSAGTSICSGTPTTLTASGSGNPAPYTYSWEPGGLIGSSVSVAPTTATTYSVYGIDGNGFRTSTALTTTISMNPNATANAGSDVISCGVVPVTLSGSIGGGATGSTWTTAGTGTFNNTSLLNATYTPSFADGSAGSVKLYLTTSGPYSPCSVTTDSMVITFTLSNVVSNAGTDQNLACDVFGTDLTADPPSVGIGTWSGAATFTNIHDPATHVSGLGNGPVTLTWTVVDGGCATADQVVVYTHPSPVVSCVLNNNVSCLGGTNGSVTVNVTSGGTVPYSYAWSNGATTQTTSSLMAGTYSVMVTDGFGCSNSCSGTITQPATAVAAACSGTNATCFGGSNGSASILASGGTPGYSYSWNNGATTSAISGLAVGAYTGTVTDSKGCTAVCSYVVTEPAVIVPVASTSANATCFGSLNGTVTVNVSGGTGAYTYLWSPSGQTTSSVTGLGVGTYAVTVTDVNGCSAFSNSTVINQPLAVDAIASTSADVTCNGYTNGSATVNVTGGTGVYTYLWSPSSQTTANASGLGAGTYSVTVTDANGCFVISNSTVVTQPTALDVVASTVTNAGLCYSDADGSVTVIVSGGTGPYTYLWSPSGLTTATVTGLDANTYTVNVTDQNSCIASNSTVVTQPALLTVTPTYNSPVCDGNPLVLSANVSGGSGGNIYSWSGPNGTIAAVSNPTITTIAGSSDAGSYSVTVTDQNGCVSAPSSVNVSVHVLPNVNISIIGANPICYGSSTTIGVFVVGEGNVTGTLNDGTPFSGFIDPQDGFISIDNIVVSPTVTTTYQVATLHDGFCDADPSILTDPINAVEIIVNPSPTVSITPSGSTMLNCSNLSIDLLATPAYAGPGSPAFSYSWDLGAATTNQLTVTTANTYVVTVTESDNNCTASAQILITGTPALSMTACSHTDVTCNGGSDGTATAGAVSNVVGPLHYAWSPSGGTNATATGLSAGIYTVTISDDCSSLTCTEVVGEPAALSLGVCSHSNVTCYGSSNGTATAGAVNNVVGAVHYAWSPSGGTNAVATGLSAGTYTVTVNDNCFTLTSTEVITEPDAIVVSAEPSPIVCHGGTSTVLVSATGGSGNYTSGTGTITAQAAGSYTYTVTDNNGCTGSTTITISEPAALSLGACSHSNVTCYGGSNGTATAGTVSNAVGTIHYAWSPSGGTDAVATGLSPGTYTVTVNDNCFTLSCTEVITQPNQIVVTATPGTIACNGGTTDVEVSATGGSGNYTSGTGTITAQSAGSYTYTVTDNNGCTGSTTITITEPSAVPSPDVAASNTCGSSVLTASNYTGTLTWSTNETTASITVTIGGTYSVYQTTSPNGCVSAPAVVTAAPVNCSSLSAKLFIQGYYRNVGSSTPMDNFGAGGCLKVTGGSANASDVDYVTVHVMNSSSPYAEVTSATGILQTDGSLNVTFTPSLSGTYYVKVTHRNSVETWSKNSLALGYANTYDFSTAVNRAYGNNQVEVETGVWAIYSGDINNTITSGAQDGVIESSDYSDEENAVNLALTGYVVSDITGDGSVTTADYNLMQTNVYYTVIAIHP